MADALIPHTHHMCLWGAPEAAQFPALCPNCGHPATARLMLAKGFVRSSGSDTPDHRAVLSVAVPFCNRCIARHRAELPATGALARLLSGFHSGEMLAAVAFAAAAAFTSWHALAELRHARLAPCAVFAALSVLFGLIARFEARRAWQDTEYFRVPAQTSVTRAFDFSDNEPAPFESPKYDCTMHDAGFAAAFRVLNQAREFRPGSPQAQADRQQANRQAWLIGLGMAAIALVFLLRDLLK